MLGHRFLLLIHFGRRTGLRRHTVLEVIEYRTGGTEAVVMSALGRKADWLRNIEAIPGPEVVIGSQHFVAAHRFLDDVIDANTDALDVHSSAPSPRSERASGRWPSRKDEALGPVLRMPSTVLPMKSRLGTVSVTMTSGDLR